MAHPRVFISSTFFDLRQVRADLERFVKQMGYDPVLHERGKVAHVPDKKREDSCYREIDICDILISIIGGRFGSQSQQDPYSISQMELRRALDRGKTVYIFIDRAVYSEFQIYKENKHIKSMKYGFVDDVKVYHFLEEVEALPVNNPISPFETAQDIVDFLREQWAGLFQRFLEEQGRLKEIELIDSMASTAQTLNQLVKFFPEERRNSDKAIRDILLSSHPAFQRTRTLLRSGYRLFFTNRTELTEWPAARRFGPVDKQNWDSEDFEEWIHTNQETKTQQILKVSTRVFDENGNLEIYTAQEWNDDWITVETRDITGPEISDDDIPF